ncbi:MAG: hypothetical protein ACXW3Z_10285, partial [Limisphaerales bacterium]
CFSSSIIEGGTRAGSATKGMSANRRKFSNPSKPIRLPVGFTKSLPRHIRDNIHHPLLRLAWFTELHPNAARE